MLVLVRLILDDQPGALSRVTTAIAELGGNITAMDVVDGSDAKVVDDLLVDLGEVAPETLGAHLAALEGTELDCVRPTPQTELHRELELISTLASDPRPSLDLLARLVPAVVRSDWAVVISSAGRAVGITHASGNGPRIRWARLPWLPLGEAQALEASEDWIPSAWQCDALALAAAPIDERTSVLACRREGPDFRPREVGRLAQLARLAGRLLPETASRAGRRR